MWRSEAVGPLRAQGYAAGDWSWPDTAFPGYERYVAELEQRAAQPDLAGAVHFAGYRASRSGRSCAERRPGRRLRRLREPFGNAVVEAQLVILRPCRRHGGTRAPGEHRATGGTGLLVPAEDVDAMAKAIARSSTTIRISTGIADRARADAIDRFSTDRYEVQVVELVRSLVGPERRAA